MSLLGKGTPVTIRMIGSGNGQAEYAAIVTGEDNGRFFVTKFNDHRGNHIAPPMEIVRAPLRMHDPAVPAEPGEQYVIVAVRGTSAELAESLSKAALSIQQQQEAIAALTQAIHKGEQVSQQRVAAVVKTLSEFVEPDCAKALRQSLEIALPVEMPESPKEPVRRTRQTVPAI